MEDNNEKRDQPPEGPQRLNSDTDELRNILEQLVKLNVNAVEGTKQLVGTNQAQIELLSSINSIMLGLATGMKELIANAEAAYRESLEADDVRSVQRLNEKGKSRRPVRDATVLDVIPEILAGGLISGLAFLGIASAIRAFENKTDELLQEANKRFKGFVATLWTIPKSIGGVLNLFTWAIQKIGGAISGVIGRIAGLINKIPILGRLITGTLGIPIGIVQGLIDGTLDLFRTLFRPLIGVLNGLKVFARFSGWLSVLFIAVDAFLAGWKKYKEGGNLFEILFAALLGAFKSIWGTVEIVYKAVKWLTGKIFGLFGLEDEFYSVVGSIEQVVMGIVNFVLDLVPTMVRMLKFVLDPIMWLSRKMLEIQWWVIEKIGQGITMVFDAVSSLVNTTLEIIQWIGEKVAMAAEELWKLPIPGIAQLKAARDATKFVTGVDPLELGKDALSQVLGKKEPVATVVEPAPVQTQGVFLEKMMDMLLKAKAEQTQNIQQTQTTAVDASVVNQSNFQQTIIGTVDPINRRDPALQF